MQEKKKHAMNDEKSSIPIDYFDRVINRIDIQAELKLQDAKNEPTSIDEINSTRQVLIDRVKQIEEAFIEYLNDSSDCKENVFCVFIKADSSKFLLGILILLDIVLKCDDIKSIKEMLETDRNETAELNLQLNSAFIWYTRFKEEIKSQNSIFVTVNLNHFQKNPTLCLKKLFFRSIANNTFCQCGKYLTSLDLSGNLIRKIGKNHLENLTSLICLNLNGNSIETIEVCSFEYLRNLKKLDLSSNRMTIVSELLFLGLDNLAELNLYNNRIERVERNSFALLKSLKSLNLGDNPIDEPSHTCLNWVEHQVITQSTCFENLSILNLSLTNLQRIYRKLFVCLVNLNTLFLNDNSIEKIENDSFVYLVNLVFLDLSYNKIESITKQTFTGLISLQELHLHKNFLKEIDSNSFGCLPNLRYLCVDLYRIEAVQEDLLKNLANANIKLFDNPNYI